MTQTSNSVTACKKALSRPILVVFVVGATGPYALQAFHFSLSRLHPKVGLHNYNIVYLMHSAGDSHVEAGM
ncbi:unnamed protein product [Protopolystoma xenopodis]|uniref:Uncharacterized protein n=1 Tax=Protopolystoma xenopodis TaxID=117903 RepID=A0A3S5CRJ0_9PLAT|nr:unnamed protein product [Protopolystoma xenopodis]